MEVIPPRASGVRKPLFITFYSFKGGVGRTMALLNAAGILAGLGRRVLMIDFDLEAPGLTLFQDRQRGEGASRKQAGLVDALSGFLESPRTAALADGKPGHFFDSYVVELDIPEPLRRREGGRLDMMPCGRLDEGYERRMHGLAFGELFSQGVGRPLFERFKALIRDSDRYDYVLIDSRTGFSDEGSICTQYLADYLIVVTGLNRQNLRGTARFLKRSNAAERKERLALVASPVPAYYEEIRAERLEAAEEMFADAGLGEVRITAQIPYHPLLALDEDPRVYSFTETDLFEAYEQIVRTLRTWAGDRPEEDIQEALDLLRRGEVEKALRLIQDVRQEEPQLVLQVLSITDVTGDSPKRSVAILEEGLDIARELKDRHREGGFLMNIGSAWLDVGDIHRAAKHLKQALSIFREVENRHGEGIALYALGHGYVNLGEVRKAIDYYEQALAIFREFEDQFGEGGALRNLGHCYVDLGEVKKAVDYYEQALAIHREVENRRGEGFTLISLGNCYADLGEVRRVTNYYEQALAILREVEDRLGEGVALNSLGVAYASAGREEEAEDAIKQARRIAETLELPRLLAATHLGRARALAHLQPERARSDLNESWAFIMEHADAFDRAKAYVLRARLRVEQGDDAGAAEDAETALDFYQSQGVDSVWSREAEELLSRARAYER